MLSRIAFSKKGMARAPIATFLRRAKNYGCERSVCLRRANWLLSAQHTNAPFAD